MITHVLEEQITTPKKVRPATDWQPAPPRRKRRYGQWLGLVVFAALAVAAYLWLPRELVARIKDLFVRKPAAAASAAPARAVPVRTAASRLGQMDLHINGLGSVTALYTVTLRSRVDGELMKINFEEGQMVQQGAVLAEIDPRPFQVQLKQAEGNLLRDRASLRVAQLDLERYNALIGSKSITQQQLDAQKALVQQSEGAIKTDQGQIDNARLQLAYCRITAPINGRIGLRMVDPGNMVRANDPNGLAVVTQLQPITVVFTIPQDDISRVQRHLNAHEHLKVDAYDRDFKTKLASGSLLALDNQVDATTGTVRLKAIFDNEDNLLFPNQFVNAQLLVDTLRDVVLVPSAAVQRGPDSTFVYVVRADSTVELHNVTVGNTEADQTVITNGLAAGEVVVIDGVDKLQPGTKVAARDRSEGGQGRAADTPPATGPPQASR